MDGSVGRPYPPADAEAAARALVEVVRDAEALGRAGRARAEHHFDLREALRRWSAATSVS